MRIGFCMFTLLLLITSSERVSESDVDVDSIAILQLHHHPSPAIDAASLVVQAAHAIQNTSPDQLASSIANALAASAGLDPGQAQNLISRLDVQSLADGLASALADSSATGDLEGEIDMTLRFDPAAVMQVVTDWLDHASAVLADKGISTMSTSSMLSAWLANAGHKTSRKDVPAEVVFLETGAQKGGYEHVMASFVQRITDANGTYAIRSAERDGPTEVSVRVSGAGFVGLFSSWLGDLAASFEEVGVRDAFIRAGLGPEEEEDTREARQHLIVSLLGQKHQVSASSAVARESRAVATSMMRTLLGQALQRSQVHATSLNATHLEQH